MLRIERYTGSPEAWDGFVASQHGASHSHLWAWRSVMEQIFGHECLYLAALDNTSTLRGVLPLVRVKSAAFGHYLVSLPFLNHGGPLGSADAVALLSDHAASLARRDSVKLLELRSRVPRDVSLAASHRRLRVVLDIPAGGAAELWKKLPAKVRSQIRRPMKEGVEVRFGADQLDAFFSVFSRHMRDLGTPTQPRRLFERIADTFAEHVRFGAAYHGDRPVAAGCGFLWGGEFEMTWASSLREYNTISPNMLLYWSFMERVAGEGVKLFDFGRCPPDSGTHRFKRQWGGRDEPLWWYQLAPAGAHAATPSPADGNYSWGPRIWKRLPMPVATALGPSIVRYIP